MEQIDRVTTMYIDNTPALQLQGRSTAILKLGGDSRIIQLARDCYAKAHHSWRDIVSTRQACLRKPLANLYYDAVAQMEIERLEIQNPVEMRDFYYDIVNIIGYHSIEARKFCRGMYEAYDRLCHTSKFTEAFSAILVKAVGNIVVNIGDFRDYMVRRKHLIATTFDQQGRVLHQHYVERATDKDEDIQLTALSKGGYVNISPPTLDVFPPRLKNMSWFAALMYVGLKGRERATFQLQGSRAVH